MTDFLNHTTPFAPDTRDVLSGQTDAPARTESCQYDPAGNLAFVTDREGQARGYTYDLPGHRAQAGFAAAYIVSTVYDGTSAYRYDAASRVLPIADSAHGKVGRQYGNRFDTVTFETTAQGSVAYACDAADRLNTPRLVADAAGTTVWKWDQVEPFGDSPANDDPDGNSVAFDLPLRLPGQYYDAESGLHYNNFREYDPSIGRFPESDPVGLRGGWNTYAYVGGSPLLYSDPEGLQAQALGCAAGAWAGPLGCGVGAAAITILGGAILMNAVGSDSGDQSESDSAEKKAERSAYHKVCDEPPPPNLSYCDTIKWKINRAKRCIAMRQDYMSKWNDTYAGHYQQIASRQIELDKLEKLFAEKCCGK